MVNKVKIDLEVNDKGSLKAAAGGAKNAADQVDRVAVNSRAADRSLKGAARTSSSGTKNFAKMAQGISGGLVPAYAAFAANIFALSAAFNFLKSAADLQNLQRGQVQFSKATGTALSLVTSRIQEASGAMLGFREAGAAAAMGMAKGFSPKQMEDMAIAARKVSTAMGVGFEDAFDRLVRGVSKAEPELLDELGVTLRLETANRQYADSINKNVDALTTYEKSQAVLASTMKQVETQFGEVEPATNKFIILGKTFEKIGQDLAAKVLPSLESFADFLNKNAEAALAAFALLGAMILNSMTGFSLGIKTLLLTTSAGFGAIGTGVGAVFSATGSAALAGLEGIGNKIEELEQKVVAAKSVAQTSADDIIKKNPKSKIVKKVAAGEVLTGLDKHTLNKALKAAEKQYKDFGEVTEGIFKNVSREMFVTFRDSLNKVERASLTTGQKIKKHIAKTGVNAFRAMGIAARATATSVGAVSKAVGGIGKAAAKLFFLVTLVYEVGKAFANVINMPATALKNFIGFIQGIIRGFEIAIDFVISRINVLLNKLPFDVSIDFRATGKFSEKAGAVMLSVAEAMTGYSMQDLESSEKRMVNEKRIADIRKASMESVREFALAANQVTNKVDANGIPVAVANQKNLSETEQLNFMASAGAADLVERYKREGIAEEAAAELAGALKGTGQKLTDAIMDGLTATGDTANIRALETAAQEYKSSMTAIKSTVDDMGLALKGGQLTKIQALVLKLAELEKSAMDAALAGTGTNTETAERLKALTGGIFASSGGKEQTLKNIEELFAAEKSVLDQRAQLSSQSQQDVRYTSMQQQARKRQRTSYKIELDILEKINAISRENLTEISAGDVEAKKKRSDRIAGLQRELKLSRENLQITKEINSLSGRMALAINNAFETGLSGGLKALVKGEEKSFKNFMKTLARGMLDAIIDTYIDDYVTNLMGTNPASNIKKAHFVGAAHWSTVVGGTFATATTAMAAVIGGAGLAAGAGRTGSFAPNFGPQPPKAATNPGAQGLGILGILGAPLAITGAAFAKAMKVMFPELGQDQYESMNEYERANVRLSARQLGSGSTDLDRHFYFDTFMIKLKNLFSRDDTPFLKKLKETFDSGGDYISKALKELFGVESKEGGIMGTIGAAIMKPFSMIQDMMTPREGEPSFEYATNRNRTALDSILANGGNEPGYMDMFGRFLTDFKAAFTEDGGTFLGRLGYAFTGLGDIFSKLKGDLGQLFNGDLRTTFFNFIDMFRNAGTNIASRISNAMQAFSASRSSGGGFLSSAMDFGMSLFGLRSGGVMSMGRKVGYATGGVARGSQGGYPAMLHGTEAIVPLPNGKSIPVHMKGNGGSSNIVINISGEGSTNSSAANGPDLQLGKILAATVQKELTKQRRSGGILSPYGAS